MRASILTIGDEVVGGEIVDTNKAEIASGLRLRGVMPFEVRTILDDAGAIVAALRELSDVSELLIVTGGLGPTTDDLTAACAARFLAVPLVRDAPTVERMRARFAAIGREMPDNNLKQADLPEGATIVPNPVGTAPGFVLEARHATHTTTLFFFPGVPSELRALMDAALWPWLDARGLGPARLARLAVFGLTESETGARIERALDAVGRPPLRVQYRVAMPAIYLTLHAEHTGAASFDAALDAVAGALGSHVYAGAHRPLAEVVGELLRARGLTLAVAESCTGGLVSALLTDTPGASAFLVESAVTYANAAKTRVLGVAETTLAQHGAVSEPCAREMAEGIRARAGTDLAIAVTGIAGPDGGTPDKPVGTVWIAVASGDGTATRRLASRGDRDRIRRTAAAAALDQLRRVLCARAA